MKQKNILFVSGQLKRKKIKFTKVKWAFHLENTDIYLICHVTKNKYYSCRDYKWCWAKVKKDYCSNALSWEKIESDTVLIGKVPKNLLFSMDVFEKIVRTIVDSR